MKITLMLLLALGISFNAISGVVNLSVCAKDNSTKLKVYVLNENSNTLTVPAGGGSVPLKITGISKYQFDDNGRDTIGLYKFKRDGLLSLSNLNFILNVEGYLPKINETRNIKNAWILNVSGIRGESIKVEIAETTKGAKLIIFNSNMVESSIYCSPSARVQ